VRTRILLAVIAVALGAGTSAHAGVLDLQQIAADAQWLAHIDLDAVNSEGLAGKLRDAWLSHDVVKRHLRNIERVTGVDLTRDLHGITFYGKRLVQNTGVVLVHVKADRDRLLGAVRSKPDYGTAQYGESVLHTWTERKGTQGEHTLTACFHGPELVVFGRDAGEVKAAVDVLCGESPALPGSGSPLDVDAPEGTIVTACVTRLAAAELPFKSPLVVQSELFWIALGEHEGDVFGKLKLVAKSEEVAAQVQDVVNGFRAMAALQYGSDERAMRVIEGLRVAISERTVNVEWRGAAEDVGKLIEQAWKKRQEAD